MNYNDLRAEIARCNLTLPKVAKAIGISEKTIYSRMAGRTEFSQSEITKIAKLLCLNEEKIIAIFFNSKVS